MKGYDNLFRATTSYYNSDEEVTTKEILSFFIPLALTSVLIMTTHSLFNVGLARLPSPEIFISAFAVAKSVMHVFQSPITMIRQAFTSLVDSGGSYRKVRRFIFSIGFIVVSILAVVAFSGLSRTIFIYIMGVTGKTLDVSVSNLRVLVVFPAFILLRSYAQGIAIKFRATPLVTLATIIRIVYVAIFVSFISSIRFIPLEYIGGSMFLGAAVLEGLVLYSGVKIVIRNVPSGLDNMGLQSSYKQPHKELTGRMIALFYMPLIATTLITHLAEPAINMGLARTSSPETAIATYAVAWSLGMIILSPINMFHQIPINYLGNPGNKKQVKRFAIRMCLIITMVLSIISFSPVGLYILKNWVGTTEQISIMAADVLKVMCIIPALLTVRQYYWGYLMQKRMTRYVGKGTMINIVALIASIILLALADLNNPALAGAISMAISIFVEILYFYWTDKRHMCIAG